MAEQITYRLALDSDINRINDFYNTIYKKSRTYDQFYWEFNSAPAGKAIYVIAEYDGSIVGTQCAIPYYVITKNNQEILSAKSEDTLVSPNHRGKHIFENMYKLLIDECKKDSIVFLWGFTYADKPFRKIGFDIPYKTTMGILTIKPNKAATYFYSITVKKSFSSYLKILTLSYFSYSRFILLKISKKGSLKRTSQDVILNTDNFNYLKHDNLFGLKIDAEFVNYRINKNPYSTNYKTICWYESGVLKASVQYNITKENVGFIIHVHFDKKLTEKECSVFIKQVIFETKLKNCIVIRFWGFTHNIQNKEEVLLFKKNQFVFLNRGISFVGLNLKEDVSTNFSNFVLSRMASQGTD